MKTLVRARGRLSRTVAACAAAITLLTLPETAWLTAAIQPGQQIGVDVGPAGTKTPEPWTNVSALYTLIPALDLATGVPIEGVTARVGGVGTMGLNNLSNTTLGSGSLASGAAPANVLCDGVYSGSAASSTTELRFDGLDPALRYRLEVWSLGTNSSADVPFINGINLSWPAGLENRALRKAASGAAVFDDLSATAAGQLNFGIRHTNPVLSGARLTAILPNGSVLLPYAENFDALTTGPAQGQIPARLNPAASASIVIDDTTEGSTNKLLAITATTPPGEAVFTLIPPVDFRKSLWLETKVKAVATEGRSQFLDLDGMLVALVKNADGPASLRAYDGKQGLANGGGTWKELKIKNYPLSEEEFFTLTVRADYERHKYDVFVNGELVAVNLGFDDARINRPTTLSLYGQTAGTNYFDDLYLSTIPPESVPYSTAGDGISDAWKLAHGISLTDANARNSDADGNGLSLVEEYLYGLEPGAPIASILGKVEIPGGFYREVWKGITGAYLTKLKAETQDYQKTPDVVSLTKGAEAPRNYADNYGQRLRGYVTLPEAGTYNFYLIADDTAELWISADGSKWNKRKAADVSWAVGVNAWTGKAEQKSTEYTFPAGQRLYVEIRHKENGGADHVRLGWTTPASATIAQVPAEVISSYVLDPNDQDDDDLPDNWERQYGLDANDNGLVNATHGKHGVNNTAGLDNYLCWKLGLDPKNPDISALVGQVSIEGVLQREIWTGIGGTYVSDLLTNNRFAQPPNVKTFTSPEGFVSWGSNYGARWRGWLTAPKTGSYKLRISADDNAQLWLSPDDTVAPKRYIARVNGYVGRYANSQPKQTSLPLELVAGQRYYVEILHKQGGGADHCELQWTTPEDSTFVPIPAEHFSSWVDDPELNQVGYAKAWVNQYNLSTYPLLPNNKFNPTSYLLNWQAYRLGVNVTSTLQDLAGAGDISGAWIREIWESGLKGWGTDVNRVLFWTAPSQRQVVQGSADFAAQIADNQVSRTRGYLVVSETGWYRFAIAADEVGEFFLSSDETIGNAKRIARCLSNVGWDNFSAMAPQLSAPVYLQTNRKYYAEVRHYEQAGNDFVQLAWATPANPAELVHIPASAMMVYVPAADDPNGFGYPQSWLVETGLDKLPFDQQVPWADPTGGGLTNLEKYRLGLNPLSLDTDGDGVSDYEEVMLSHTDPKVKDFDGTVTTVATLNGADYLPASGGTIGNWQKSGTATYAADIRGTLAYSVTLAEPATSLRLRISGGQYIASSSNKVLDLDVYVGAAYVGRTTINVSQSDDLTATGTLWLPSLAAGPHTLRVVWLNGVAGTSLRLDKLELQHLGGIWAAARQNALSTLDETPAVSYTSPYCLEGGAVDAAQLEIQTSYIPAAEATDAYSIFIRERFFGATTQDPTPKTQHLTAHAALRGKYSSDLPLSPVTGIAGVSPAETTVTVHDSATGATRAKTVTWQAYDLAGHDGEVYYLRAGDALLLKSPEDITVTGPSDALTLSPSAPLPFVFAQPGTYTLTSGDATVTVQAVAADLSPLPTVIMGQKRRWVPALLPVEAIVSSDEELYVTEHPTLVGGQRALDLTSTVGAQTNLVARLGENGAILASTPVNTLVKYGNPKTTWDIVKTFDDGMQLWRGQLSFGGNLPPDFRIVITPYKSGVSFLDGGLRLELTAADFDENGMYTYYIIRAPETGGAPCHYVYIYDGAERISAYEM